MATSFGVWGRTGLAVARENVRRRGGGNEHRRALRAPSRYSHVRMEAKRRALEEIAARQRAADETRKDAERQQPADRRVKEGKEGAAVDSVVGGNPALKEELDQAARPETKV